MATSSIRGGSLASRLPSGTDLASLGPSDSSDSGSDSLGTRDRMQMRSDSDATGTGEAPSDGSGTGAEAADILPDHLIYGRPGLRRFSVEREEFDSPAGVLAGESDEDRGAFDAPGSALDDPDLMDTTADVIELAQDEGVEDVGGDEEAAELNRPRSGLDQPAGLPPLAGHRGLQ